MRRAGVKNDKHERANEMLTRQGYLDAIAGKPAKCGDPDYLAGYRQGTRETAENNRSAARRVPDQRAATTKATTQKDKG